MRRYRYLIAACMGIILFQALSAADCFAAGGSISGCITRDSDGSPLEGIEILVYDGNWRHVTTAKTDAKGCYKVGELAAGAYFLRASDSHEYMIQFHPKEIEKLRAAPVPVTDGSDVSGIDFALFPWGSISGRVVGGPDGTALRGIRIKVFNKAWTWLYSRYTDEGGNFVVEGLKPGVYYLATSNDRGYLDECYDDIQSAGPTWPPETAKAIVLEKGSRVAGIDFSLDLGGTISGRVTRSSDGAPLNNVAVAVLTEDLAVFNRALSDGDGGYALRGLPEGRYYLRTSSNQGYVDMHYRDAFHEKDAVPIDIKKGAGYVADFRLDLGGSVAGRITGDPGGQGLEDAEVRIYDTKWDLVKYGSSDRDGNFSLGGLPTGAYYLRASSQDDYIDECFDNAATASQASAIQVKQGEVTTGVDFSLLLGGSISGRVTAGAAGRGLHEVYVNVHDLEGRHAGGAPTDLSGLFTVRKLPPGSYYVQTSNALGYPNLYYDNAAGKAEATRVTVAPGALVDGIDFMLAE